jgi:hypothetical protein
MNLFLLFIYFNMILIDINTNTNLNINININNLFINYHTIIDLGYQNNKQHPNFTICT